jgi:hypothetical protein
LLESACVKQPPTFSGAGQNWQWPENTWFRERLNAIKAQENQLRRRPTASVQQREAMSAAPTEGVAPLKAE